MKQQVYIIGDVQPSFFNPPPFRKTFKMLYTKKMRSTREVYCLTSIVPHLYSVEKRNKKM